MTDLTLFLLVLLTFFLWVFAAILVGLLVLRVAA